MTTHPPPDRLCWDRGDRTVVYRPATGNVTIHGGDDDPIGFMVTPHLADAIAAAIAFAKADQAEAEAQVWIDDDITNPTPTSAASPYARPIQTQSYGG